MESMHDRSEADLGAYLESIDGRFGVHLGYVLGSIRGPFSICVGSILRSGSGPGLRPLWDHISKTHGIDLGASLGPHVGSMVVAVLLRRPWETIESNFEQNFDQHGTTED